MFSGFSWEPDYALITLYKYAAYCQVRLLLRICLQQSTSTPFNHLFRLMAELSLLRLHITPQSSTGILTGSSIGIALRLSLRSRLTLIRLALIRNPWSFGEEVFHPLYRYLYLHLLFHPLQQGSPLIFNADNGMLPYRSFRSHGFGKQLMPDYYPCPTPRPVSCYALFK